MSRKIKFFIKHTFRLTDDLEADFALVYMSELEFCASLTRLPNVNNGRILINYCLDLPKKEI